VTTRTVQALPNDMTQTWAWVVIVELNLVTVAGVIVIVAGLAFGFADAC
jgi:hypothetical protein